MALAVPPLRDPSGRFFNPWLPMEERAGDFWWWQTAEIDGTVFTLLPAQHWSRRFGMGWNEPLWGSWLIERDGRKVYFGGDSGSFKGYREFGRRFPGIDVALLGVGAYAPRWSGWERSWDRRVCQANPRLARRSAIVRATLSTRA